ncbi:hypothetical protein ETB97_008933 [Aspergillus alliaceus]|uniref:Uncharacterized protein n=1 Tax=Petromyces alliaceus TaxID=209559 RepID=A0A8H6ADQ9_PETAA|nr:hypothetical protein ETB97_008933 [Aspergillus burnettii]
MLHDSKGRSPIANGNDGLATSVTYGSSLQSSGAQRDEADDIFLIASLSASYRVSSSNGRKANRLLASSQLGAALLCTKTTFGDAVASCDFTRVGLDKRRVDANRAREGELRDIIRNEPTLEGL